MLFNQVAVFLPFSPLPRPSYLSIFVIYTYTFSFYYETFQTFRKVEKILQWTPLSPPSWFHIQPLPTLALSHTIHLPTPQAILIFAALQSTAQTSCTFTFTLLISTPSAFWSVTIFTFLSCLQFDSKIENQSMVRIFLWQLSGKAWWWLHTWEWGNNMFAGHLHVPAVFAQGHLSVGDHSDSELASPLALSKHRTPGAFSPGPP